MHLQHLDKLPDTVGRHLTYTGAADYPVPEIVRTRRKGEVRLREDQGWAPFLAAVRYTTDPPGFVREARVKTTDLASIRSHDELVDGTAREQVWPMRRWRSIDSRGPEVDQDATVRFMSEMAWFPAAYRLPYVAWESIDETTAAMTVTIGETLAHAVLTFDSAGGLMRFEADRFRRMHKRDWLLCTWAMDYAEPVAISGVRVPGTAAASWYIEDREFPYIRVTLEDLTYT